MMRAASGTETVRETEEVLLVYRVEQCGRRPLDNLVFQGGDRERALPAVRLGNILSPGRQCPIRSPLDPCVLIQEVGLPVRRIGLPCQPVHARGRFPLDGKESVPQQFDVDMVEERSEPLLLPFPCGLSYARQHLWHGSPALRPARVMLVRIPLGPSPWLHRLRGGSLRLVRQLRSYYGWVRLPAFVHHRLSVLPSRCGPVAELLWPNAGSPKFRRDPFARDVLYDPGRRAWPRLAALSVLRSTLCTVSAPATYPLRGSITHPTQPLCTLRGRRRRRLTQHSLPGCLLSITWVGLSPTDRASFAWRLRRVGPRCGRLIGNVADLATAANRLRRRHQASALLIGHSLSGDAALATAVAGQLSNVSWYRTAIKRVQPHP